MRNNKIECLSRKANELIEQGEFTAAAVVYDELCSLDAASAHAWLAKSAVNERLGHTDRAIEDIEQALGLEPGLGAAHYNLGRLYHQLGRTDIAIDHLENAVRLDERSYDGWMLLADIYGQLSRYQRQEDCCRKALYIQPDSIDASLRLAEILEQNGRVQESIGYLERAIESDSTRPSTCLQLARACAGTGKPDLAVKYFREYLRLSPEDSSAWSELGKLLKERGDPGGALDCFGKALAAQPDNASAAYQAALVCHERGDRKTAADLYHRVLQEDPDNSTALFNLSLALQGDGMLEEAGAYLRRALEIRPDYVRAYGNLGYIQRVLGDQASAISTYRKALAFEPHSGILLLNLGYAYKDNADFESAIECFNKVLEQDPGHAEAMLAAADAYQLSGSYDSAIAHYRRAIQLRADHTRVYAGMASCYIADGRQEQAVAVCNEALLSHPDDPDLMIAIASALMTLKGEQQALEVARRVVAMCPQHIEGRALLSSIYDRLGKKQEACNAIMELIDNKPVANVNLALAYSGVAESLGKQYEVIRIMEDLLASKRALAEQARRNLHYALGLQYDSTGRYDEAFRHYSEGSRTKPLRFRRQKHQAGIDKVLSTFNREFMESRPVSTNTSDKPIFIVGMPRSGTSLTEQILSSHPRIYGAGELPHVIQFSREMQSFLKSSYSYPRCITEISTAQLDALAEQYLSYIESLAPGASRIVDKMPGNFMNLGLIEMLFPNARIIHCRRNPIDVCLSCYFQDFSRTHPYSYDLDSLAVYYNNYRRIMQHWRKYIRLPFLELHYEKLVDAQEEESRRLVGFCGLDWNERCLDFHRTGRFVVTSSHDQVRKPIYRKSKERWRNYEKHIQRLIDGLQPSLQEH